MLEYVVWCTFASGTATVRIILDVDTTGFDDDDCSNATPAESSGRPSAL